MHESERNAPSGPNHEAIPPDEAPAASPTLDAPPRVVKRRGWWWVAGVLALCFAVLVLLGPR
jgi:hypothetical protein